VLERHYETLAEYLRWQTGSLVDGIAPPGIWGDWASPGYAYAPEDHRLTATAYIYRQSVVMADIAGVLGHGDDAADYLATADHIRERFNASFLNEAAGRYETSADPGYRQTSNALPLAFGMVPAQYRAAVLDGLAADVRGRDGHLNTGILGTPALLETLTHNGHADLAYGIVGQTTFPSWGEWIAAGADTLWEDWGLGGRSRNHPMHGTVDDWFFRDVVGIAPDPTGPGYRHTLVQPHPTSALTHAKASHVSPYGRIDVAWRLDDSTFRLDVRIPANTTATVRVPATDPSKVRESGSLAASASGVQSVRSVDGAVEIRIGSGSYRFSSPR
jgi:alpha-L-rhamnosidase